MFTKAGNFPVKVTKAFPAECKYDKDQAAGGFDVVIEVTAENGESDCWFGAVSTVTPDGAWNKERKNNAQLTDDTLAKIGYKGGYDFSRLAELVGVETIAHVKERQYEGKTFFDVKGLGGFAPKVLDAAEVARRMQAMMSGGVPTPAPVAPHPPFVQPPVQATLAAGSPFPAPAGTGSPKGTVTTVKNPFA